MLEAPSLLFLPASTIEDNIKSLCRFPGLPAIDEETYRRAALKQPRLLCLRPQTIADNIRGLVNHLALCGREGKPLLKCREYIAAALKRPQLLYQLPETLAANVSGVVSHPALKDDDGKPLFTTETYLQTALKKPQLFLHAPETVVEHVTRFLRHPAFADENGNSLIKAGDYRKAVLRHPALLLQNPDLAAANISGVVNHPLLATADGSPLTSRAEYVRAALKQASLFIITPDTVVGKINGIIRHPDLSGTDGRPVIDKAACLKAALKMPALFVILPETIAANVNGVVRHPALQNEQGQPMFRREDYIRAAVRQPSLLVQSPQTVAEHVTIIKDLLLKEEICPDTAAVADFCLTNPITMVLGSDNLKSRYLYAYAKRRRGEKPGKKSLPIPRVKCAIIWRKVTFPQICRNATMNDFTGGTGSSLRTDGQTCLRRGRLPFTVLILSAASGREKKNNRPKKEKSPYCTKKLPPSFSDAEAFFITERISADKESFSGTGIKHLVADGDYRPVKQFYFTILLNAFFPVKKNQRAVFVAVPVINQHRRQIEIFRQTVRAFVNLFPRVAGGKQQNAAASHLQFPISALQTGLDAIAVAKQVTAAVRILRNACFPSAAGVKETYLRVSKASVSSSRAETFQPPLSGRSPKTSPARIFCQDKHRPKTFPGRFPASVFPAGD